MIWRSINVYYYQTNKSGLLLDAIRPAIEQISSHVRDVHYLVHWLQGPHVRINVRTEPRIFETVVLPTVNELVKPYLVEHPSQTLLDPELTLIQHKRLAELEHESGPLFPMRPDNSVHEVNYDQRLHVLGSVQACELLADFYTTTTPIAFEMLDYVRSGGQLVGLAFDVMIATAHGLSGTGLQRGFVSFRSHADAFLSWWPEAEGLREAWNQHYADHVDVLADRVRAVMKAVESGYDSPWVVRPWLSVVKPFLDRGGALIEVGILSMDPPWASNRPEDDEQVAAMLQKSPFHGHRWPRRAAVDQVWFSKYRLMLNYTYLHLTRVGLTPVQRFLLCHLAANACEDLFGEAATDIRLPTPGEIVNAGVWQEMS